MGKHPHSFGDEDVEHFGPKFTVPKWELALRGVLSFFINGILREIIAVCIAVILMPSPDPLSFVLNCLAFAYITKLDDITGPSRVRVTRREAMIVEGTFLE